MQRCVFGKWYKRNAFTSTTSTSTFYINVLHTLYINVPEKERLTKRKEKSVWKPFSIFSMLQVKNKKQPRSNIATLSCSTHSTRGCLIIMHDSKASRSPIFFKIDVFKNFAIFAGEHLCWGLFVIKLQSWRPATLLKRDSNTSVFLWILRNF